MWEKIELPKVPTPITAVSFPEDAEYCVAWTSEGLYRLRLTTRPHVSRLMSVERAKQKFHHETGSVEVMNTVRPIRVAMHGRCADLGTFRSTRFSDTHDHGDRVEIDAMQNEVRVVDVAGNDVLTIPGFRCESPLAVAGFCSVNNVGYYHYFLACDGESYHAYRYREGRTGVAKKIQAYVGQSQDALYRLCLENPEDDGPRLVYADWLEEHGDPDRAQFIRVQCRLAERQRTGFVPPDDPEYHESQSLRARHGKRWAAEIPRSVGIDFAHVNFYRGFPIPEIDSPVKASTKACRARLVEHLPLDALGYTFINKPKAGSPFWNWPALTSVRYLFFHAAMDQTHTDYAQLLRLNELSKVRQLSFRGWYSLDMSNALIEGPIGSGVEILTFGECIYAGDRSESLLPLAEGRTLPNLHTIRFVGNFNTGIERNVAVRRLAGKYPNVIRVPYDDAPEAKRTWTRIVA